MITTLTLSLVKTSLYRCCVRFSYLAPYWLISRNTITFQKYFWCSLFCEFHSNSFTAVTHGFRSCVVVLYSKSVAQAKGGKTLQI